MSPPPFARAKTGAPRTGAKTGGHSGANPGTAKPRAKPGPKFGAKLGVNAGARLAPKPPAKKNAKAGRGPAEFNDDPYGERGPPPPRQRRAFSTMGGPIEVGGDPDEARQLGKLLVVDPGLARALTHGFHSYAGRMHPSIARGAVGTWSRPGELVVDPFCGSGTVLVEAMGLGRRAVGVDASPLGVAIARARTTTLGPAGRERLHTEAARIATESGEHARKRRRPESPPWAAREFERFHPHVALELLGLRVAGDGDPRRRRRARACGSVSRRSSSR